MKTIFLILSIILPLFSPLVYARSILRGEAKPHRITRFVLLVITSLTTVSLFSQGDTTAIWLAAVTTIQAIIIFLMSLKYGMGGWAKIDIMCLVFAMIGIIVWKTTDNPALALYFAIGADFIGMMPTIIKTYHHPETETWTLFAMDTIAGTCNLLALPLWSIQTSAFPMYIVLVNGLIAILALQNKRALIE